MGLFEGNGGNQFPHSNFHDLNLDWILNTIKTMQSEFTSFISQNSIKYANPIQWDITKQYERNTVVVDVAGNGYLSVKAVPSGISIDRTEYWTVIGNFSALWGGVKKSITLEDEGHSTTATKARSVGTLVWLDDDLIEVTENMLAGDAYVLESNCRKYSMQILLTELENAIVNEASARIAADNEEEAYRINADIDLQNSIDAEEVARIAADNEEEAFRINADLNLQNNIDAEEAARIEAIADINEQIAGIETEVNLNQFPRLVGEIDDTLRIKRAIEALGGTHDITSEYIFEPAKRLIIPEGTFIISSRILIDKNNIKIIGAGWYNTIIKCSSGVRLSEMIRFRGAYNCELSEININGGLPFTPTGTEEYGADIGVVLDQVAFFESHSLNVTDTRLEGMRVIHLWESYFENLRLFNLGLFGSAGARTAGMRFTSVGKEELFFPGGESNNITFNKVAFGCAGCLISMDEVPVFNASFRDIIAEGRSWQTLQPYSTKNEDKIKISILSSNLVFDTAHIYAHEQPFESGVALFNFVNCGPACKVVNWEVYQENTLTGHYNEINRIVVSTSAEVPEVNISVRDLGGLNGYIDNFIDTVAEQRSLVRGAIEYITDQESRTVESLFANTSMSRFTGDVVLKHGLLVDTYSMRSKGKDMSTIGSVFAQFEEFKCRAWVKFNGVTGEILASGNVASVTHTGLGTWMVNFTNPLPDNNYAVVMTGIQSNSNTEYVSLGTQLYTGFGITNNAAGTFYDPTVICAVVFK